MSRNLCFYFTAEGLSNENASQRAPIPKASIFVDALQTAWSACLQDIQ